MQKTLNLHLISDGTGQTLQHLANSTLGHFEDLKVKRYYWPLTCAEADMEKAFNKISSSPGIVLYTLRNRQLATKLNDFCLRAKVPCISAIENIINIFEKYLGTSIAPENNLRLNEEHSSKVAAINFTIKHDDGASVESINQADIIIVGASRVSKTPTSIYLAYNGFKTANIPYIEGITLPQQLSQIDNILIVGLIASPTRLSDVRSSRVFDAPLNVGENYASLEHVINECKLAKKTFLEHNWPIVDVTYKSIEETAAAIIKLYYLKIKK